VPAIGAVEAGMRNRASLAIAATFAAAFGLHLGCASEDAVEFRSVEPICVEEAPADADWACGEVRTVSCEEAAESDQDLHVEVEAGVCAQSDLLPVDGPFGPGEHTIDITDDASGEVVCTATLEVVDDEAPTYDVHEIGLWPPNHSMHDISLFDCIEIHDCDPDAHAHIVAVSSDEPVDANGDGHTEPDIVEIDEHTVSLRAERQGGSNGRVYTIDFEVEDGSGNVTEGACHVVVTHDRSGAEAIDDGPVDTVDWSS
jgi:hypothetical protein